MFHLLGCVFFNIRCLNNYVYVILGEKIAEKVKNELNYALKKLKNDFVSVCQFSA